MQIDLGNLSPLRMMLPSELVLATKLTRKVARLRERWRSTNSGKDLGPGKERALSIDISVAEGELESLVDGVLARQLGLKRYMVVHVQRDGGHEDRFQLLSASVHFGFTYQGHRWMWDLEGRRLRKDGSIGERPGGMAIDAGVITRRMLDGSWVELHPTYAEEVA